MDTTQASTGDAVLVKSSEMTEQVGAKKSRAGWREEGLSRQKNTLPLQFSFDRLLHHYSKGTVQRELRGVKIGINRTARINCIAGKCHLPCPKGHHHERSLNVIGGYSTF